MAKGLAEIDSMTGTLKKRNASQSQMRATEKRNTRRNPASQIYCGSMGKGIEVQMLRVS
jgi:hypothetical protein